MTVPNWRTHGVVLACASALRSPIASWQIFGVKYLSTLFSISLLGHQIGSFIGVWHGGYMFDATGFYLTAWLVAAALGVLAAIVCLPIDEPELRGIPVNRPAL